VLTYTKKRSECLLTSTIKKQKNEGFDNQILKVKKICKFLAGGKSGFLRFTKLE
jgi:hypothetical protein